MSKRWTIEVGSCENGYTVAYWAEAVNAVTYIASTPAKLLKIVKAIVMSNVKDEENAD